MKSFLAGSFAVAAIVVGGCAADQALGPWSDQAAVAHVTGLAGRPFALRVSSRGRVFVTQQDLNSVVTFRVGDRSIAGDDGVPVSVDPGDVILTADGNQVIASTFYGGALHFINASSLTQSMPVSISTNAYRLALSRDESRVFVTSVHGTVYVVDRAQRALVDSVRLSGSVQAISRRPRSGVVAVASTSGDVWLLDEQTLEIVSDTNLTGSVQDIVHSPDGTELWVASESPAFVAVLDAATLEWKGAVPLDGGPFFSPFGLAISPDGRRLLATSPGSGAVALIDPRERTVHEWLYVGGMPRRAAFEPSGPRAFVANEDNRVHVIR